MPGRRAKAIILSKIQEKILSKISRAKKTSKQLAERVDIILLSSKGLKNKEIAGELSIMPDTVSRWRNRWVEAYDKLNIIEIAENEIELKKAIIETLSDKYRSGAPATFTAEQLAHIVSIACENPEDSNRPISHWSQREIADEMVKRGIVERISRSTIWFFFKRNRLETS